MLSLHARPDAGVAVAVPEHIAAMVAAVYSAQLISLILQCLSEHKVPACWLVCAGIVSDTPAVNGGFVLEIMGELKDQ